MSQRESVILRDILVAVTALPNAMFERMNTGVAQTASGNVVRFGNPGGPDIRGTYRGRSVAIEAKTDTGRQSEAQRRWQAAHERAGGIYIIARSADDATHALCAIQ